MTKPTGRPKGRPKTKEYITLMARVPQKLADRVQRYAHLHQQPISMVLRDSLELLLEEDRYQSFLSDRNAVPTIVSDTNENVSDTQKVPSILSDTKEKHAYILSDIKEEGRRLPPAQSRKDVPSIMSDKKEDVCNIVSDTKEGTAALQPASAPIQPSIVSDRKEEGRTGTSQQPTTGVRDVSTPPFDKARYTLGKLCPRGHEHGHTGQSLLRISNRHCLACDREKFHERKRAKRQAQPA